MYKLFTAPGGGGMIVEAALAIAEIPVEIVTVDWQDLGWNSKTLSPYNPLGQIPTLILDDGTVMTESAAILLHIADVSPDSGLVPPPDDPLRPGFLRWLVFLVSAVYPTFTYADVPERWVDGDEASAKRLRTGADEHRQVLNKYVESFCGEPWFLGEQFSCIDLYFWVMRHWRPGTVWFEQECPRLNRIGLAAGELPAVKRVGERNFPAKGGVAAGEGA
jgi:GST-like protein